MSDPHEQRVASPNFDELPDPFRALWRALGGGEWSEPHPFAFEQSDVGHATEISHDNNPIHSALGPDGSARRAVVPGAIIPLAMQRLLPGMLRALLDGFKPVLTRIECDLTGLIRVGDRISAMYRLVSMTTSNVRDAALVAFEARIEHATSRNPVADCRFSMLVRAARAGAA